MTERNHISRTFLAMTALLLSACGGSEPDDAIDQVETQPSNVRSDSATAQKDLAAALGGGKGGGTLIFDGTSHAIESVLCRLDAPVEVGTVGEGYRVLIDGAQRPRASIVDADSIHWTHVDWKTVNFTLSGSTITGSATRYQNNVNDQVVEASFEIECP